MNHKLTTAQLETYLDRIGLTGFPELSPTGLHELHRAQFFKIPFENFDIPLGRGIDLSPDHVFKKLVEKDRGGYCFELNGLFLRALRALGFDARPLMARVHLHIPPSGKTHQLNLVQVGDEEWISDVGFGAGGPRIPLPLCEGVTQTSHATYEVARVEPWGWMLRVREGGSSKDSYSFTLHHVTDSDIEVGNHFTSTSPSCHFTHQCVASLPTPEGRISLLDEELTEVTRGRKSSRTIAPDSYDDLLRERFAIDLPSHTVFFPS